MSRVDTPDGEEVLIRPPAHPVAQLQGPFEESMIESVNDIANNEIHLDSVSRRTLLLDAPKYERIIAGRWKQKPGEKYHPLWKLVAQLSFGMHLIANNLAKSEEEVMKILQTHVDDIDGFLERTTDDFQLAQTDILERLRCLKLPLNHAEVFDRMLEDRSFRASILEGNQKIEHIVSRTKRAMKDSLKDVQKGFDATNVLDKYLISLNKTWARETAEHEAVLVAMLGNVEGWRKAFLELHTEGNKLAGSLKKLTELVSEMERRAAVISRRQLAKSQMISPANPTSAQNNRRNASMIANELKPLPLAPGARPKTPPNALSNVSSRPGSAEKSSRGGSSRSGRHTNTPPKQNTSPPQNRPTRATNTSDPAFINSNTSIISMTDQQHKSIPVELPADVPEDALRQAPVSIKNRLSMVLGLKPRDNSEHRVSSIYYPKALGDLLKTPPSPQLLLTPQLGGVKAITAIRSPTPQTGHSIDSDYFSAHEQSPSIGVITPNGTSRVTSAVVSPLVASTVETASPISPNIADSPKIRSSLANHALTSHQSVMIMAQPPAELPTESAPSTRTESLIGKHSQNSSLGEPGPEIAESELGLGSEGPEEIEIVLEDFGHEESKSVIPQVVLVEDSPVISVAELKSDTSEDINPTNMIEVATMVATAATQQPITSTEQVASIATEEAAKILTEPSILKEPVAVPVGTSEQPAMEDSSNSKASVGQEDLKEHSLVTHTESSIEPTVPDDEKAGSTSDAIISESCKEEDPTVSNQKTAAENEQENVSSDNQETTPSTELSSDLSDPASESVESTRLESPLNHQLAELDGSVEAKNGDKEETINKSFVAELEALPVLPKARSPMTNGPIELEAPWQHFRLPPRSSAKPKPAGAEGLSANITRQEDFYKLPAEQTVRPGSQSRDLGDALKNEPLRPLKLRLARQNGKVVPVPIEEFSGDHDDLLESSHQHNSSSEMIEDLLDTMDNTAPKSSIRERSTSDTSVKIQREERASLSNTAEHPSPRPGSEGRLMDSPEVASTGHFGRERKKRSSGGSRGGWRNLLASATSPRGSTQSSSSPRSTISALTSPRGSALDMMTQEGKDILWFKGDKKSSVRISSG